MDLVLNNLQRLICHKTHQTKPNQIYAVFRVYWTCSHKNATHIRRNKINKQTRIPVDISL